MYFRNRAEAGRLLAKQLDGFRAENTTVIALSPGAVLVGAQIAMRIHADMAMLFTENIVLPGENEPLAAISAADTFTYNEKFSPGQIEEFMAEYLNYIQQERMKKIHLLHQLLGRDGEIDKKYLRRHTIILVSDGLSNGFSIDVAADFLKPVKVNHLVIATPLASMAAVDRMHLAADEVLTLSVVGNYIDTPHYYQDNTIPPTEDLLKVIRNTPIHWFRDKPAVAMSKKI